MKAIIFAAGLGNWLKPLTDTIPKALVSVARRPVLEHVILELEASGFIETVISTHHFGEQITDFLKANNDFGLTLHIFDEWDLLLDMGGGIRKARRFFENSDEPFLAYSVDILSDMNPKELYGFHLRNGSVATLLASRCKTFRYLLFDAEQRLCGWTNKDTGQMRPEGFLYDESLYREYVFSGIHVLSPAVFQPMEVPCWEGKFSIMDFYPATCGQTDYRSYPTEKLELIDIGKLEASARAEESLRENIVS